MIKQISILLLLGIALLTIPVTLHAAPGDLDPTFGNDGIVVTDFVGGEGDLGNGGDSATAVALQTDGKIVAAGFTFDGSDTKFALARYNTDGSLDTSFGTGGMVTGIPGGIITALALQTDGKIIAGGRRFVIVRYNPDGSLDTSFGTGGVINTPSGFDLLKDLALQADGKIVATSHPNGSVLVRYNTDGSLDTSFDGRDRLNGKALALQADGKIIVAEHDPQGLILARYNADGSVDTTFGSGGRVFTTELSTFAEGCCDVVVQSDGKIIQAGGLVISASRDVFGLVRVNPDGSLDTSFGDGGLVLTDLGDPIEHKGSRITAVVLQTDGKIIAVGVGEVPDGPTTFAIARYNADGSLDTSFGSGGVVRTEETSGGAFAAALQADGGKLVVAGGDNGGLYGSDFALARYEIVAVCGDGQVSRGVEQCDDGGTIAGDGCDEQCVLEERSVTETVSAGTPVTTDTSAQGATPSQPVQAAVTPSVDGTVTVTTSGDTSAAPDGFQILTGITHITAPDGTADDPLILVFRLNDSILPIREDPLTIQITKDGVIVPSCQGVIGVADPDPCAIREVLSDGDLQITVFSSTASDWGLFGWDVCAQVPQSGCLRPVEAEAASLQIKNGKKDSQDTVVWQWNKGAATLLDDFGDPTTETAYGLCIYDTHEESTPVRRLRAVAPAAGTCKRKACWKATNTGFTYTDLETTPEGVSNVQLKTGVAGKASLKVQGKGANLAMPSLPLTLPVTVQLQASNGQCWEAQYEEDGVMKNDASQFKAKGQ